MLHRRDSHGIGLLVGLDSLGRAVEVDVARERRWVRVAEENLARLLDRVAEGEASVDGSVGVGQGVR